MANGAIWFRINGGNWNGNPSADPSTQTGGFDISSITGPYLPFMSGSNGFAGLLNDVINCGSSSFAYTPPSGATALGSGITWNPSDASSPPPDFSGGNLNVGLGSEQNGWVRATSGANAGGLQYFEQTLSNFNCQTFFGGVANAGATISTGGDTGAGVGTVSYTYTGGEGSSDIVLGTNTVLASGLTIPVAGDVLGIAIYTLPSPPTPTPPVTVPVSLGGWRGQCGINWQGLALVGDAFSGVVGLSDFTIFNEYGNQMRMLATTPPIHKDRKRISIPRFEIEVEAGLGTQGAPEVPPLMIFDYSKDGGVTWTNLQVFRSMGAVGEYIRRLRWINLGNSRTWVFRIQFTSEARPAIIGTYYDAFVNLG